MELLRERTTAATLTRMVLAPWTNIASISSSGKEEQSRTGHSRLNFLIPAYRVCVHFRLVSEPNFSFRKFLSAEFLKSWWTWSGSNRRPLPCHGSALPAAPQAHMRNDVRGGLKQFNSRLLAIYSQTRRRRPRHRRHPEGLQSRRTCPERSRRDLARTITGAEPTAYPLRARCFASQHDAP